MQILPARNVLGGVLQTCGADPLTGAFRTGCCETGPDDPGVHAICCILTDEFLAFTASRGNNLSTPQPTAGFTGLRAGDRWCLCVSRWREAFDAGLAPPVVLEATHEAALDLVALQDLKAHAHH